LNDYNYYTGYSIGSNWQKINRPLKSGERLIPKQLFILGGKFELDNMMLMNDVQSMRVRAGFASKLKDLPDGTSIKFELTD
jgi:hypothetical protein